MSSVDSVLRYQETRVLEASDSDHWMNFVASHPDGNLYHTLQWREIIIQAFSHRPIYLLSGVSGEIRGVMPMFLVRMPFLGSKLISLPYDIASGGPLATDAATDFALAAQAIALAKDLGVGYLELRCDSQHQAYESLGLKMSQPVVISDMKLGSEGEVWSRVRKDHRKSVSKAKKRGIIVREAESFEDFQVFYQIYLQVFRAFGTPPYARSYFRLLWDRLWPSRSVRLLLADVEEECVGGLLLFRWGRNLVSKFAACLPEAVPLRAYAALYWRAIQLGIELDCENISWGTSLPQQSGLIEFKERWGADSRRAVIYTLSIKNNPPSLEKYYDPEAFAKRIWRQLPLRLTPVLGGFLNRWFC